MTNTPSYYQPHAHNLDLCDWRTCICGRQFKSSRSLHMHVTKANRAARDVTAETIDTALYAQED